MKWNMRTMSPTDASEIIELVKCAEALLMQARARFLNQAVTLPEVAEILYRDMPSTFRDHDAVAGRWELMEMHFSKELAEIGG